MRKRVLAIMLAVALAMPMNALAADVSVQGANSGNVEVQEESLDDEDEYVEDYDTEDIFGTEEDYDTEDYDTEEDSDTEEDYDTEDATAVEEDNDDVSAEDASGVATSQSTSKKKKSQKLTAKIDAKKIIVRSTAKITASGIGKITYKSSNKKIATVTKKGVVKGKRKGTVTITVRASGNKEYAAKTKKIKVKVRQLRILVIGNSFIMVNSLCSKIQSRTDAHVVKCAINNSSLADHLNKHTKAGRHSLAMISKHKWDYVVLQEYSSKPALRRKKFLKDAKKICKKIKANGATPVFFCTWSYKKGSSQLRKTKLGYKGMYQKMQSAYIKAAKDNDALLANVGKSFYNQSKKRNLYRSDGVHPNHAGSRLAARIIAKTILKDARKKIKRTS